MKKIIYTLLLFISVQAYAYAIVIHNPNGVAVWFESAVPGTGGATTNYDSIASATLNQILATQLQSGDTIYVQDTVIANKIDSLIAILSSTIKTKDSLAIAGMGSANTSIHYIYFNGTGAYQNQAATPSVLTALGYVLTSGYYQKTILSRTWRIYVL